MQMTSKWWVNCSQKNNTSPVGVLEVQRLTDIQISETESQPKHLSEPEKDHRISSHSWQPCRVPIHFWSSWMTVKRHLDAATWANLEVRCGRKIWITHKRKNLRLQHTLDYRLYIVNSNSWNFCALKRFLFAINPTEIKHLRMASPLMNQRFYLPKSFRSPRNELVGRALRDCDMKQRLEVVYLQQRWMFPKIVGFRYPQIIH